MYSKKIKMPELQSNKDNTFSLLKKFEYKNITVPKGYKTNGADVPRIFWFFFPPFAPERLNAIVVHDYLCEKASKNLDEFADTKRFKLEIKKANNTFREMLLQNKNSFVNRTACNCVELYWSFRFLLNNRRYR